MSSRSFAEQTVAGSSASIIGSIPWRTHVARLRTGLRSAGRAVVTRQELEEIDARILADIGVSRAEAEREARRAPWDLAPRRRMAIASPGGDVGWNARAGILARQTSAPLPRKPAGNGVLGAWDSRAGDNSPRSNRARGHLIAFRGWVAEALRRRRSRQAITGLDAYLLKDIGASYADAEHEANKPFWR